MKTNFNILICLFAALALESVSAQDSPQCYISGECTDASFSDETTSTSYEDCQTFCQDQDSNCEYFTFNPSQSLCITFSTCPTISAEDCPDCLTGDKDCPDQVCDQPGECPGGEFIDSVTVDSSEDCLVACQDDDDCLWYQFDSSNGACVLLANCPGIYQEGCDTCVVGLQECDVQGGGLTDFSGNLFVAGGDLVMFQASTDVEVVNMDPSSGVQLPCVTPAQLPESRDEHISTFSNNLVYTCAGYTRTGCRAYNNETYVWEDKGQMDHERALAAAVMLNDNQWWITGGDQNEAQVGIDTTIIYDTKTDLISGYVNLPQAMWRHSLVKISDSEYFVIGGATLDDSKAYIFNHDDETFEEQDSPGISILKAFVGLIEKDDGTQEIVATGGDNDPVGTHIFNLDSKTWRQGPQFPAPFFDGVSVPYGNTFLAVGGIDHDDNISDAIYYYDVNSETWENTNRVLQEGRYFHSAVVVPDDFVQCF